MKYGAALIDLERGHIAYRPGWHGKGQFVAFVPAKVVPNDKITAETRALLPGAAKIRELIVGGYFVMWTAEHVWQPGWTPSVADQLADDWCTQSSPDFPAR